MSRCSDGSRTATSGPPRRLPAAARFGAPHTVSATNYATELQIAFGPARTALATWTQGTLGQSVMSAAYLVAESAVLTPRAQ